MRGSVLLAASLLSLIFVVGKPHAKPESRREGRIAFSFGESGADHPAQLALMDADGKNRQVLPPYGLNGLSFSPNGRLIAFGMGFDLYSLNVGAPRRYRRVLRNGRSPDWSPSGRAIAFVRQGHGIRVRPPEIWTVDTRSRRQRRVVRNADDPSWSPDGTRLAFARGGDIWVMTLAAGKARRLIRNARSLSWSPDGHHIVFERGSDTTYIYIARADGTSQRRLIEGLEATWAPTGQEIAFIGKFPARNDPRGLDDAVIRMRLDGSRRRMLFGTPPYCGCGSLDWAR